MEKWNYLLVDKLTDFNFVPFQISDIRQLREENTWLSTYLLPKLKLLCK